MKKHGAKLNRLPNTVNKLFTGHFDLYHKCSNTSLEFESPLNYDITINYDMTMELELMILHNYTLWDNLGLDFLYDIPTEECFHCILHCF